MSDYVVRPKRRRNGALKGQAVDPCLGYYIPLVNDGQSQTGNLHLAHTSNVDTATEFGQSTVQEDGQPQRSSSPTSSSLELANAEWSTFVPVVRPSEPPRIDTPRHEEPLSVEEFLKRSLHRTYAGKRRANRQKKKLQTKPLSGQEYGGEHVEQSEEEDVVRLRSRRVIRKIIRSDPSSSDMEMETSSISFDPPTPLSEKKQQHPRQKKSLKERIYEAAVATSCDPDPKFVHPEIQGLVDGSMPLPLRFIPGPEPTRSKKVTKTKKRNWTLVDPRKSMAIRTRTFSSRIRPPNLVLKDEPLKGEISVDTYKFTGLGAPSFKTMDRQSLRKKTSNENEKVTSVGLAPRAIACPPLTFVSIREAEDNYASLNIGRGVQANQKMKSGSASALHMARLQEDKNLMTDSIGR